MWSCGYYRAFQGLCWYSQEKEINRGDEIIAGKKLGGFRRNKKLEQVWPEETQISGELWRYWAKHRFPTACGTNVEIILWGSHNLLSGSVWQEDPYVLPLMSPLSLFKRNSMLLPGTEVTVFGRLGSPLANILFRTKPLSLVPLSWDMDCLLTLWLTLPLVPLITFAIRLVFWSLSFLKEVSYTTVYIYS